MGVDVEEKESEEREGEGEDEEESEEGESVRGGEVMGESCDIHIHISFILSGSILHFSHNSPAKSLTSIPVERVDEENEEDEEDEEEQRVRASWRLMDKMVKARERDEESWALGS